MKKKLTIMLFSLLLAVGWTNDAQAQLLPAETHAKKLVDLASWSNPALTGTMDHIGTRSHSHDAVTPNKTDNMLIKKNDSSFKVFTGQLAANSKVQSATKSEANRPSNRHYSPMRAGQVLDMKSITKDEANAITYTWTDAEGYTDSSTRARSSRRRTGLSRPPRTSSRSMPRPAGGFPLWTRASL